MNILVYNGDSIVDTILFDVIRQEDRSIVKVNGIEEAPAVDFIEPPSGFGFEQGIDLVTGDTIDYVLKQTVKKRNITLTLHWEGTDAYGKYVAFADWIAQYFDLDKYRIRLSYKLDDMSERRYVEVSPIDLSLKGRDLNDVEASIILKPLTPFYEEGVSIFSVASTSTGKKYNYAYPYVYGGGNVEGRDYIENKYIKPVPLRVVLKGPMSSPFVAIRENVEGATPYAQVRMVNSFELAANQTLTIDAFNNKVTLTTVTNGVTVVSDAFNDVDKSYQTFLFAKPGKSRFSASIEQNEGTCEIYYVRYVLS